MKNVTRGHRVSSLLLPVCALVGLFTSCASYTVPGRAADLSVFTEGQEVQSLETDERTNDELGIDELSINEILARRLTAIFPTGLAVVRVQAPDYASHTIEAGLGRGAYSVVIVRDVEEEEDFERLATLPRTLGAAPFNRLLVPGELKTDLELRKVAAQLHADVLLVYTLDTVFELDREIDALDTITLGLLPKKELLMRTTASALLMDTRTGYLYAVAEGTSKHTTHTSFWTRSRNVDEARRKTEKEAFQRLVDEVEGVWTNVLASYDR